ncbi:MAG TPA: BMP family ABC transporter substrate-binding protein [Firmicutes bacterium]|nr:BMP family ABC transporter substrate-binding protein [Bacillota bacterium]
MRKIGFVLSLSLLLLALLAGCSGTDSVSKDMVAGFIYIGPPGDHGWTYAQDKGRLMVEKELGVRTIYKESVPEGPEVKDVIRNMIDQGAKIIFAGSFGYMDYVEEVSKEYPDIIFLHCSGYKMTENMGTYFGRMYQARYLSGLVAGLKTKTGKIGYVAAFEIPEVIRGINAFALGVRDVNPDAKVYVRWTHTWYDPGKETEAAKALLDEKCDVIAQHQDTAGPQQAAEARGAFSIGYNSDMYSIAPRAYMTAPIWNWGPYFIDQIKKAMDGTWTSGSYWGGLEDGIVDLAPLTPNAPAEAREIVEEMREKIISGEFHVFEGPLKDQSGKIRLEKGHVMSDEMMLSIDWFVSNVVGRIETGK